MTNKEIMELTYVKENLELIVKNLNLVDDFITEIVSLKQLKSVYAGFLHGWNEDIKLLSKDSQKRLLEMVTNS